MTKAESQKRWKLITAIADRAQVELKHVTDRMSIMMDLESVPDLDLEGLLKAEPFDFGHDIYGIMRHMDRSTYPGKLTGCFVPRYCRKAVVA